MPSISRFFGIVITMYPNDHTRPHFHARYGDDRSSLDIESLEVLAGTLAPRQLKLVRRWAALHREELRANWERIQAGGSPKKIAPLG